MPPVMAQVMITLLEDFGAVMGFLRGKNWNHWVAVFRGMGAMSTTLDRRAEIGVAKRARTTLASC